jgi:hypothetical protein
MAQSKNPKKKVSTSPTSQKSTERQSSKPSKAKSSRTEVGPGRVGINPPREKPEPKPNPKRPPKSARPEPAYNLVQINLTTGEAEALEFPTVNDLAEHLRGLVNKDFQVFVFEEGRQCFITKGPFRYLKLPDESAVPLFQAPSFAEMEIDESGILAENFDPEAQWSLDEEEAESLLGDAPTGSWPYTNPDFPLSDNFGDVEDTGFHDEEEEEELFFKEEHHPVVPEAEEPDEDEDGYWGVESDADRASRLSEEEHRGE